MKTPKRTCRDCLFFTSYSYADPDGRCGEGCGTYGTHTRGSEAACNAFMLSSAAKSARWKRKNRVKQLKRTRNKFIKENARLREMCRECDMSPLLKLMERGAEQLNAYRNHPHASGMVDTIREQLQHKITLIKQQREERKHKLIIEQDLSPKRICLNEYELYALERHLTAYIKVAKQEETPQKVGDIINALEEILNKMKQ